MVFRVSLTLRNQTQSFCNKLCASVSPPGECKVMFSLAVFKVENSKYVDNLGLEFGSGIRGMVDESEGTFSSSSILSHLNSKGDHCSKVH